MSVMRITTVAYATQRLANAPACPMLSAELAASVPQTTGRLPAVRDVYPVTAVAMVQSQVSVML